MKLLYSLLFICFHICAIAQTKSTIIELEGKSDISSIIPLTHNGGFLIKYAKSYPNKEKDVIISKYNSDLDNIWNVGIVKTSYNSANNVIIASKFSSNTYYIQQKKGNSEKINLTVNRINESGEVSIVLYENSEFRYKNIIAMYADASGLNIITNKSFGKSKYEKIDEPQPIIVYKLKSNQDDFEKIETDIINNIPNEEKEFIEFLGQDENFIYMAKKNVNIFNNSIKYTIYFIDKESYLLLDSKTFELEPEKKIIAANNMRSDNGNIIMDNDYEVEIETYGVDGKNSKITYTVNSGSFGCSKLDLLNDRFYVYGLTSNKIHVASDKLANLKTKKAPKLINDIGGAYVYSFDFNSGKIVYKNEFAVNKDVSKLGNSLFLYRYIWLDIINKDICKLNYTRSEMYRKDHKLYTNTIVRNEKAIYAKASFDYYMYFEGPHHIRSLNNTILNSCFAPKEAIDFVEANPKLRYKKYSIFGFVLDGKIILAKNSAYTKHPLLELNSFDFIK